MKTSSVWTKPTYSYWLLELCAPTPTNPPTNPLRGPHDAMPRSPRSALVVIVGWFSIEFPCWFQTLLVSALGIWWDLGVSENVVYPNYPMVLLIIFIGNIPYFQTNPFEHVKGFWQISVLGCSEHVEKRSWTNPIFAQDIPTTPCKDRVAWPHRDHQPEEALQLWPWPQLIFKWDELLSPIASWSYIMIIPIYCIPTITVSWAKPLWVYHSIPHYELHPHGPQ